MGREEQQLPRDNNEAIVVGAVESGAPWFLTGWAEGTEVEFMIEMGCQVTILVMSVFERMCASDPRIQSRLHPCGRRLISADSSSLMVRGELDMTVVFSQTKLQYGVSGGQHWIRRTVGNGGIAVLFASSARSLNRTIVGGWSVNIAATSTAAGCPSIRSSHEFVSSASR